MPYLSQQYARTHGTVIDLEEFNDTKHKYWAQANKEYDQFMRDDQKKKRKPE